MSASISQRLAQAPPYSYRADPAVPLFPDDKALVVFDGVCVLCSHFARFILTRDRDFAFRLTTAQSPLGQALFRHYGLDTDTFETNLVLIDGRAVTVKGPKGTLSHTVAEPIDIRREDDGTLQIVRPNDERQNRALHGLSRSLVANMVIGVTDGYSKTLEIVGTGYRVQARGSDLEFALGFSHPVVVPAPEGITFTVEAPTRFTVSGVDKQKVGEVSANIRKLRKPDPYKGKGVRYQGEQIRRKAGKAGK